MKRARIKRGKSRGFNSTLRPRSKKRAKFYRERYLPFRADYLQSHRRCEVGVRGCTQESVDLQHILSRGRSGRDSDLIDTHNVVATCRSCHDYIETHREWSLEHDYLRKGRAA